MWRYDKCADDVIDDAVNIKGETRYAVVKIYEEIDVSSLLNLSRVKAKLTRIKKMSFLFLLHWTYPGRQNIP